MKRFIEIYLLIFLLFISCKKEEFDIVNLNGNKITALGHAGMGTKSTYPLDCFESIFKCLNLGMDGTEFDVQMTNDSVLVAYHEKDLSDLTNLDGIVNSLSWAEVKNAKYNQLLYLNYSIVSLENLFANIPNLQSYKFTFDCKLITNDNNESQYFRTYINAVINIIQKYQIENNVYIESQSKEFLIMFKSIKPNYRFFIYPPSFEIGLDMALSLGLYGITISTNNISKEQIKTAHNNNLLVAIWNTFSESDNIEAIKKNPDFIQTDKVKNLISLLK